MLCWQGISGSIGVIVGRAGKTLKALDDRLLKNIGLPLADTLSVGQNETRKPIWGNWSHVGDIGK